MFDQITNTPVQPSTPSSPPVKLWTAGFIGLVSLLLGFPAGIVLASINWMRMNLKNKAFLFLVGGVIGVVVLTFILTFLPGNAGRGFSLLVNVAVLYFVYKQVGADINNFKSSNNSVENASQAGGCLIGLLALVSYFVLAFGTASFIGIVMTILGIPVPQ